MRRRTSRSSVASPRRRAMVLLAVLVVVTVLALAAYRFSEAMSAEYQAMDSYIRMAQARSMADSGVHYAAAMLADPNGLSATGGTAFDNPTAFQGIVVRESEQPRFRGRFSIVAPADPESGSSPNTYRFGLEDEGGKINVNALLKLDSSGQVLHDTLMKLPNMTEDVANSIVDWIDADDNPRTDGAETDYYSTLNPPYTCKNGPIDSLEELLYVKGVTPQLLYGNDRNRNGVLDPDEDDGSGVLDRGWSAYLTAVSREQNVDSQGQARIYVNDSDLQTLQQELTTLVGESLANYIIAYRLYGTTSSSSSQSGTGQTGTGQSSSGQSSSGQSGSSQSTTGRTGTTPGGSSSTGSSGTGTSGSATTAATVSTASVPSDILNQAGNRRPQSLSSLFRLIGSTVTIPSQNQQQPAVIYSCPLNDPSVLQQSLPILLDKLTTVQDSDLPARVNIATAPRAVLAALPGLEESDVQTILNNRPAPNAPQDAGSLPNLAWLLTSANLPPSKLITLERYITARSQVYRVQAMGYFDGPGPTARIEAVIDTNAGRPRITYWRDLTELGRGTALPAAP